MSEAMSIHEVLQYLPHRYPFLLVDKVVAFETGKSLTAIKNVSYNEPFFQGHFPTRPIMPGVLILEALAQTSGLLAFRTVEYHRDEQPLFLFVGIDKARFKRPVEPGDQLTLHVEYLRQSRAVWKFDAIATVGDETAAAAELMCAARTIP